MKKIIALVLALVTLLPLAVSCTSEPEVTTAASTTVATTTAPVVNKTPLPSDGMDSQFAEPAYLLMRQVIKDYWRTNYLRTDLGNSNAAAVWGLASFIEAAAEAYRLFPEDKKIKQAYEQALNKGLDGYKVTATITTPDGNKHNITYYNATRNSAGDYYYDDDAWICIQFLNAYELLKDEKYLEMAEETLEFLWTGWDDVLGGGIYWDKSYGGKHTCSNGPVAISFLWAYQLTKKEEYLEKGKQVYEWTREKLLASDNLYIDNMGKDGGTNNWKAAYNQGTPIYAGALLYEITGEERYLEEARATVKASLGLMFTGRGSATRMNGNPIYKSWCIGWLVRGYLKFYEVDPDKDGEPMEKLEAVLKKNLKTKNKKGYYDPYFQSGDWKSESTTDVLQPCGIASVLCLSTYYDLYMVKAEAKN